MLKATRTITVIILFIISTSFSDEIEIPVSSSLASTEGMINSIVGGHVCAISGDFIDSQTDLVVPGPESLTVQRTYCSSDMYPSIFRGGWKLSEPDSLKAELGYNCTIASAKTAHGAHVKYAKQVQQRTGAVDFELVKMPGITNCRSSLISGRTNIRNNKLQITREQHYLKANMVDSFGYKRKFCCPKHEDIILELSLQEEWSPHGTLKQFEYGNNTVKVTTYSSSKQHQYGHLFYQGDKSSISVDSSTNEKVDFKFKTFSFRKQGNKMKRDFLTEVYSSQKPNLKYEYVRSSHDYPIISTISVQNQPKVHVEYYESGKNFVGDRVIDKKESAKSIDRVKILKTCSNDGSLKDTYRFFYHFDQGPNKDNFTEVLNADNQRTDHFYTNEQRLQYLIKHHNGRPYLRETYTWGPNGSIDEGNLAGKYVQQENEPIQAAKVFYYDDRGNVTALRDYSFVNGNVGPELSINNDGKPHPSNKAPYYLHTYTYEDGTNLLLSEHEANGKNIFYTYHPNTDLIASKILVYGESKVLLREYQDYDENCFLFRKVVDNGTSHDRHNHTDVTCMKVTYYKPRLSAPFGVPDQIDEMYRDCKTGKEHLLHRIVNRYHSNGNLIKQDHYDSNQQKLYTLEWEYNSHGKLTREVNALGYTIERKYDEFDRLVFEQGPSNEFYTTLVYDKADQLIEKSEYHPDGKMSLRYRYDLLGNVIATEDAQGNQTLYAYNDLNQIVKINYPDSSTEEFDYDIFGKATYTKDRNENVTRISYNSQGNPLVKNYSDGTRESFEYYQEGTLAKSVARNGSYTTYYRDCMGRLLEETTFDSKGSFFGKKTYNRDSFHLLEETDPEGNTTRFEYDPAGRLIKKWDEHLTITFEYDTLNRIHKEINWISNSEAKITVFTYDFLDRITEEQSQDLSGKVYSTTKTTYNAIGDKTSITFGDYGALSSFNSHRDPIEIVDQAGNITHFDYDYHYCYNGKFVTCTTITDPLGNKTTLVKDVNGNIAQETRSNAFGMLLSKVERTYSPLGELLEELQIKVVNGSEKSNILTKWEYNSNHELLAVIEALGTTEQRTRRYIYNSCGQKSEEIKPDGVVLKYLYDGKARLKRIYSSDKTIDYKYTYDKNDQVIKVRDAILNNISLRKYDNQRLLSETLGNGFTLQYSYDNLNRKKEVVLPDSSNISYRYDAMYLREVSRNNYRHVYSEYDNTGNVITSLLPFNAGTLAFQYDQLSRKTSIHHPSFTQSIPQTGYDLAGNLLSYKINGIESCFSYDDLYHLIDEKDHKYSYDSLNNKVKNDNSQITYNALNQPKSIGGVSLEYDLNGNLVRKGENFYTYDALNRLIKAETASGTYVYTYDYCDRRLSKNELTFLYDGNHNIGTFEKGKLKNLRILGDTKSAEIGSAIALEYNNQIFIPIHDHIGNLAALLYSDGSLHKQYTYSAFGIEQNLDLDDPNPWRYSSKYFDLETNLIYFGRRYYDPELSRWITADPLGYEDGPNLYAYVQNRPLTSTDLFGLITRPDCADLNNFYNDESMLRVENYDFEKNVEFTSFTYDLSTLGLKDHSTLGFGFENGIDNRFLDSCKGALYISQMSGYNTYAVYNSKHFNNGLLSTGSKLFECALGLRYVSTEPSRLIMKVWDDFFKRVGKDGYFLQICHSQGCIHVRNALAQYDPELRKRILVVAIAPGGYIDHRTCGQVWHYRTPWDVIPWCDGIGMYREREMTTVVKSHKDENWIGDHSFMSKTYKPFLERRIQKFINSGGRSI